MNNLFKGLLVSTALTALCTSSAFGAASIKLVSGGSTVTIADNGVGDSAPAAGNVVYNNGNFNGWNITVTAGVSSSPNASPVGIDLTVLANCVSGNCTSQTLEALFSDTGFTTVPGSATSTYSGTDAGTGNSATGNAYVDNSNTLFGEPAAGKLSPTIVGVNGFVGSSNSALAVVAPYSLTIDDVFAAGAGVRYSTDHNIGVTPEPAAVLSLGTLALGLAGLFRKKLQTRNN